MYSVDKTDIMAKYFKVDYQTNQPFAPVVTGVSKLEDYACKYLELLFTNLKHTADKPPTQEPPTPEDKQPGSEDKPPALAGSVLDELNKIINDVTEVIRNLDSDLRVVTMPILGDLAFMKKQAISKVPNDEAYKIITEFTAQKDSMKRKELSNEERLASLVRFIDNIRRYAEVMLNSAGCEEFGHSSRKLNRQFRRKEKERIKPPKIPFKPFIFKKPTSLVKSAPKDPTKVTTNKSASDGGPRKSTVLTNRAKLSTASQNGARTSKSLAPPNTPSNEEHSHHEMELPHSSSGGEMIRMARSSIPSSGESQHQATESKNSLESPHKLIDDAKSRKESKPKTIHHHNPKRKSDGQTLKSVMTEHPT